MVQASCVLLPKCLMTQADTGGGQQHIIIIIMRQRHGSGSSYGYGQVYIWSQFWFGNINWKITAKLDVFTDCGSSCDHRTSGCGSTDFHNSVQHDQSTIFQCFMFQVIQFSFLFVDTSHGDVTPSGDTSHDDVTEPLFSICMCWRIQI